jgi:hypothetical protein
LWTRWWTCGFHTESSLFFDKVSDYQLFKEYPAQLRSYIVTFSSFHGLGPVTSDSKWHLNRITCVSVCSEREWNPRSQCWRGPRSYDHYAERSLSSTRPQNLPDQFLCIISTRTDSNSVKFATYSLKISHRRHVCKWRQRKGSLKIC